MAAFELNSKIKIGEYSFYGVAEVRADRSMLTFEDTGSIKLPATARIKSRSNPDNVRLVNTHELFEEGDPVNIELAYNGRFNQEFAGFVKRVNKTVPCEIEIEGYSWQLKRNNVNKFWKSATLKEVMAEVVKDTDIKVVVAADMPIVNFLARNATGAEVLDNLLKKVSDNALIAFFTKPDTLWIGLDYTEYKSDVKYNLGFNCIRDDQLKERVASKTQLRIEYVHKTPKGERVRGTAVNGSGAVHKKTLTSVSSADWLNKLAKAKMAKEAFDGLEGKINGFLEPFAEPGDKAIITDNRFTNGGSYILESTSVKYGTRGARRESAIGAKVN